MEKWKNIAAIYLVLNMFLLTYFSVTIGAGENENGFKFSISELLFGTPPMENEIEVSGVGAYPRAISMVNEGKIYTENTATRTEEVYKDIEQFYYEAVGSLWDTEAISQEQYLKSINENCIIVDYSGKIPLYLLKLWANREIVEDDVAYILSRIVIHINDKRTDIYFMDENTKKYYVSKTAADADEMSGIIKKYNAPNAIFAMSDNRYEKFTKDTIIQTLPQKMKQYKLQEMSSLSADNEKALLSAIDMNPYFVKAYPENNGSNVYVNDADILKISKDGYVVFNGKENGISLIPQNSWVGNEVLAAEGISKMQAIYAAANSTSFSGITLESVIVKENEIDIFFNTVIDGVAVKDDIWDAQMRIKNGVINYFTFPIPRFEVAGEVTLLTQAQWVLAVEANVGEAYKTEMVYVEENGLYIPDLGYYK